MIPCSNITVEVLEFWTEEENDTVIYWSHPRCRTVIVKSILLERISQSMIQGVIDHYVYFLRGYIKESGGDEIIYTQYSEKVEGYPQEGITSFLKKYHPEVLFI